jgi:hypothetical protein
MLERLFLASEALRLEEAKELRAMAELNKAELKKSGAGSRAKVAVSKDKLVK